jgi:hypothetical protein
MARKQQNVVIYSAETPVGVRIAAQPFDDAAEEETYPFPILLATQSYKSGRAKTVYSLSILSAFADPGYREFTEEEAIEFLTAEAEKAQVVETVELSPTTEGFDL